MHFSELIGTMTSSSGEVALQIPEDWMQGRSVFGGLQAAVALTAMRTLVPDIPLRTFQATFMAPPASTNLQAQARILRQGKSAIHVEARLLEGEQTLGIVIAVFGAGRVSTVQRVPEQPNVSSENARKFAYLPGLTPTFTQHFDASWLRGGFPFSGNPLPEVVVMLDMIDEGNSTEAHVLAIADFIPPVALSGLKTPVAGSTLSWMIEFLTDEIVGLPLQGWRVDAEMTAAKDGYTHQTVMLWGPQGQPIALSRQNMVVFG